MTLLSRIGLWSIALSSAMSLLTPLASAQYVVTPACVNQTYDALAHEKRVYRSILFGQKSASELPTGSVRYDTQGRAWLKKANNSWNSVSANASQTISDRAMDDSSDVPLRYGIFETRKTPTSDLIPAVTQAFRAYQCRLFAVCASALASQSVTDNSRTLTVQPDGCVELTQPVFTACKDNTQATASTTACTDVVTAMLEEEQQQLLLLITYDASVRSLYQFAGIFDGFLKDVRFPLIEPLWQAVRAIGSLDNIPCFIGQCDQ